MNSTIIVQMADEKWTRTALYEASELARQNGAEIVLVKFLPTEFLAWMVDERPAFAFTETEQEDIESYRAIAQEHDVPFSARVYAYTNLDDAVTAAADELNAQTVFVSLPHHMIPLFDRIEAQNLQRKMGAHQHELRTFDAPAVLAH